MVVIIQNDPSFESEAVFRDQSEQPFLQVGFMGYWAEKVGATEGTGGDKVARVISIDMGWTMGIGG